jgi:hypothetical protein
LPTATLQTGTDGQLDGTSVHQLDAFFATQGQTDEPLLVYFHGGLVSHGAGMAAADKVATAWAGGSTLSVVWRTGPLEVIRNNLHEAVREPLFQDLAVRVLKWAVGKLADVAQGKAGPTLTPASDARIFDDGDYADFSAIEAAAAGAAELTPEEEAAFVAAIEADPKIQEDVWAVALGAGLGGEVDRSKAIGTAPEPRASAIDERVLEKLVELPPGQDRAKGLLPGWAWFAARAGKILFRVVQRVVQGTHHGTYPTVVEEVARELYLAAAGHFLWKTIKTEVDDTFANPTHGGSLLGDRLHALRVARPNKRVVAVGHSAGSIYVCGLLDHVARLSPDVTLDVALLAPAVTVQRFDETLARSASALDRFRMFSMDDAHEQADRCLGLVYPRSLLYLVSGAAEDRAGMPLLGLARHVRGSHPLLGADPSDRAVWSVEDRGPGLASTAIEHGAFDDDPVTLASVARFAGLS